MLEEEQQPKGKKPRLRSMKAMLAETISELTAISQDATQKPAKRSDAVMTKANLLQSLYQTQSEEARARLKHADVEKLQAENDNLKTQVEQLRAELSRTISSMPAGETYEERLARRIGQ